MSTTCKIVLVGQNGVGKSAIQKQICTKQFTDEYMPTEVATINNVIKCVDGTQYDFIVIDMPSIVLGGGNNANFFDAFIPFARTVHAILMVYDMHKRESFERIQNQMHEIKEFCKNMARRDGIEDWTKEPEFMLVANKLDLDEFEREVSKEEGETLAKCFDIPFMEVSAWENINIELAFIALVKAIRKEIDAYQRKKAEEAEKKAKEEEKFKSVERWEKFGKCVQIFMGITGFVELIYLGKRKFGKK